jgi:hypothetical protein
VVIIALAIIAGVAIAVGVWAWLASPDDGGAGSAAPRAGLWTRPVVSDDALEERLGLRVTQVAVTGGDGLLDLRFQVLDPAKAAAVHAAATPPGMVDEESDVLVSSLLMSHSHKGAFRQGATYYLVFTNPGNVVKRGNSVTVLLGNTQLEHVIVR